jgi:hypothetical protein
MQSDSGQFNYRTDVNEFLSRIEEMIIVEGEKLTFNRAYLHNSSL